AGAARPARARGLEHENVETLGGSVDGRAQPRRARAHDDGVPHLLVIDGRVEGEAVRGLLVARGLEDGAPAADEYRHFRDRDVEAVEDLLGLRVLLEVDVRDRVSV